MCCPELIYLQPCFGVEKRGTLASPCSPQAGGGCSRCVCGVEVLLGYCCDKPGEPRSRGASPALASPPSAGAVWQAVLEV